MLRTIVESPYAGNVEVNLRYLRACMRDCLLRGEAPFASHGLYTQEGVLDDGVLNERTLGIDAGFAWRRGADKTAVYTDLGISNGMRLGIADAIRLEHTIEHRSLGAAWRGPKVKPRTIGSRTIDVLTWSGTMLSASEIKRWLDIEDDGPVKLSSLSSILRKLYDRGMLRRHDHLGPRNGYVYGLKTRVKAR